jgi:hypothetical protein
MHVFKAIDALLEEFKNDHDYDPGYDYYDDAIRYVDALMKSQGW